MITELTLTFIAGLLGSSHCIGMCGGFSMILGVASPDSWSGLWRQLAYSAGRVFTYATLGAVAGLIGHKLTGNQSYWINVSAAICVLAGLFLIVEGLSAAGFSLFKRESASCGGCLSGPLFMTLLRSPGAHNAFLAGLLTGFLPCGLVYAFLSLAAAQAEPMAGLAIMVAFGLGTVPLMVLTGVGSRLLGLVARKRLLRAAAWCVVATGVITIARGTWAFRGSSEADSEVCPFCSAESSRVLETD